MVSSTIDKVALVKALRELLTAQEQTLTRAAEAAKEAATHEQSKPENNKDTRALESSYLAGGQASKAREIRQALNALGFMILKDFGADDAIAPSAVVRVTRAGEKKSQHYFIATHAGGFKLEQDGLQITVITTISALGQALLGKRCGDVVELAGKDISIDEVR